MAKKKFYDENGNEVKAKEKKPFYKKWWFWLLIVIIVGIFTIGGIEETNETDSNEAATEEKNDEKATEEAEETEEPVEEVEAAEEEPEEETNNEIVLGEPIELGDYTMTIQGYSLASDYEGKNALIIDYDWVNNSDEAASPFVTFELKGFQNNVETEDVFMVDGVDLGTGQKEVRPEGTIVGAQDIVGIDSLDEPLELELDVLFSFDSNAYTTTVDLSSLQ